MASDLTTFKLSKWTSNERYELQWFYKNWQSFNLKFKGGGNIFFYIWVGNVHPQVPTVHWVGNLGGHPNFWYPRPTICDQHLIAKMLTSKSPWKQVRSALALSIFTSREREKWDENLKVIHWGETKLQLGRCCRIWEQWMANELKSVSFGRLDMPLIEAAQILFDPFNTGCFFNWYPPKKLKYGKPRLGESTAT